MSNKKKRDKKYKTCKTGKKLNKKIKNKLLKKGKVGRPKGKVGKVGRPKGKVGKVGRPKGKVGRPKKKHLESSVLEHLESLNLENFGDLDKVAVYGEEVKDIFKPVKAVQSSDSLDSSDSSEKEDLSEEELPSASVVEDILFKLPVVDDPFTGTPQQVQKELDSVVKKIQKNPDCKESRYQFDRIHLYMHGYLINIVLKQFPYIKGMQTVDIYQQTLSALWFKAIPGFKKRKKMSFLNFAKMCIRRHLITELNNSKTVQKHQPINKSVSLDSPVTQGDDDSNNTFSNTVPDGKDSTDKITEKEEAFKITKDSLLNVLSEFERVVLAEYLSTSTYKEIAKNIAKVTKKRCATKSVDNALLRIRKKAIYLKDHSRPDDVPLFIK